MLSLRGVATAVWLAGLATGADAASVTVAVTDASGKPVSDAVILLTPAAGTAAPARGTPVTRIIDQKDEAFVPYVEVFRPGDRVVFRNSDGTRHHVYSFSPVGAFEFVLAPAESSPPITLDRLGAIAAGCNIHDRMITHLYVSDAPYAARSENGRAVIEGAAAGDYVARIWHPQQRRAPPEQKLSLGAGGGQVSFELSLFPDPRRAPSRERSTY